MQPLRASQSLPPGFSAVDALSDGDSAVITIGATSANSPCPSCGVDSGRAHSRYPRSLADLPIAGQRAVLVLLARRFRCEAVLCGRRIFAERLDGARSPPWTLRSLRQRSKVSCPGGSGSSSSGCWTSRSLGPSNGQGSVSRPLPAPDRPQARFSGTSGTSGTAQPLAAPPSRAFEARLRASIALRDAESGNGIPPRQTLRRRRAMAAT
jgi:hypothetical protein